MKGYKHNPSIPCLRNTSGRTTREREKRARRTAVISSGSMIISAMQNYMCAIGCVGATFLSGPSDLDLGRGPRFCPKKCWRDELQRAHRDGEGSTRMAASSALLAPSGRSSRMSSFSVGSQQVSVCVTSPHANIVFVRRSGALLSSLAPLSAHTSPPDK